MSKKENFIIEGRKYNIEELNSIWNYFKENGTPRREDFTGKLGLSKLNFEIDKHRDMPEYKYVISLYDHLDVDYLTEAYFLLYEEYRQVKAQLELKGRKPLTKAQFESNAYNDYLKNFEEETRRLQEEAGILQH